MSQGQGRGRGQGRRSDPAGSRGGGRPSPRRDRDGQPRQGQPGQGQPRQGQPRTGKPVRSGPGARGGGAGRAAAPARRGARPAPARPADDASVDVHDPHGIRLQKLLAAAGLGSRRACELLITSGRVQVDGHVVRELGVRIDPVAQAVHVDGMRVQLDASRLYVALHKPLGVVSTMHDELGRPCVGDLLEGRADRLFHVGRLDAETDGLLLLTNDGDLANRLQHPSYEVPKVYVASVPGPVPKDLGRTLRSGVELEDGVVAVDSFRLIDSAPGKAIVEVVLHEGRKHVVRRLLQAVGHPVETLTRTQVGPVRLGELRPGKMRPLNSQEVARLYEAAGL